MLRQPTRRPACSRPSAAARRASTTQPEVLSVEASDVGQAVQLKRATWAKPSSCMRAAVDSSVNARSRASAHAIRSYGSTAVPPSPIASGSAIALLARVGTPAVIASSTVGPHPSWRDGLPDATTDRCRRGLATRCGYAGVQ